MTTSTNEFHQVMPFSLFHCASDVPQTKTKQALSVTLTHSNKTEMAYQVMREIAENGYTYRPIDQHRVSGREVYALLGGMFFLYLAMEVQYNANVE
jgi:hypothetical protein